MAKIIEFLGRNWKLLLIAAGIVILLAWVNSRAQLTQRLWEMVAGEIKDDQEEIQKDLIGEINRLADDRERILKQLQILQSDREKLRKENESLEVQKCELEKRLAAIIVPSAPSDIVTGLRKQGFGSARARDLP